jgi:hypothetical protein
MKRGILSAAAAVAAVAGVYAVVKTFPAPAPPEAARAGPSDPEHTGALVRLAAKNLVAREVIAGRTTLPEATALFEWLNGLYPPAPARTPFPWAKPAGLPDGDYTAAEAAAAEVVQWVAAVARREYPDREGEVAADAVAEFLAARSGGQLAALPEVDGEVKVKLLARAETEAARYVSFRSPEAPPARLKE